MSKLTSLSKECIHIIISYLGFQDAFQCQEICKTVFEQLLDNYFWQDRVKHIFLSGIGFDRDFFIENSQLLAVRLLKELKRKIQRLHHLEFDIIATSSIDRESESPKNTLSESVCYALINSDRFKHLKTMPHVEYLANCYHIQRHCGCAGPTSCYWSSHPTANANKVEYLTVQLSTPISYLLGFSVTPYQAFFHPNAPVYGPREVCIQFLHPLDMGEKPNKNTKHGRKGSQYDVIGVETETELTEGVYFQSPFFPLENVAKAQTFFLSAPLLCVCSQARLVLRGFNQKQIVEDVATGAEEYYMCLSNIHILGLPLRDFAVQQTDTVSEGSGEDCRSISYVGQDGDASVSPALEKETVRHRFSRVMTPFLRKHFSDNKISAKKETTKIDSNHLPLIEDVALAAEVQVYVPPLMAADLRRILLATQVLLVVLVACLVSTVIGVIRTAMRYK